MGLDDAKAKFEKLKIDWLSEKNEITTEQDARFQIVNRILTEILGWSFTNIKTEPHVDGGYIDYLLTDGGRAKLVVEAKRVSALLSDTRIPKMSAYKIGGPALQSAYDGILQMERYCIESGAPFCALTNGVEWIAHWPTRGDGRPRTDYKAVVFPSLDSISDHFAEFYDLFSYEGVLAQLFKVRINEAEGISVSHTETLRPIRDAKQAKLQNKTELARDLDGVFKAFFSSMSGENDPEMLAKCFVESKESREADASLEKIARNLINTIRAVESNNATNLEQEIREALESTRREFILIIGNKGAGKTTFIDRFFRLVLNKELKNKCLLLRIDMRDSTGQVDSVATWLTQKLINLTEEGLFPKRNIQFDDLQGIFYKKYQRWSEGEYKFLYVSDKTAFKIKFGEYIDDLKRTDPLEYLHALLSHAVRAHSLMPCLIFDNTDHFPQYFQEAVFQYAQSVHRAIFSFVLCPITDRTIWQLSKSGPFQSYDTKAFYLPVPSTKDVLSKRVDFLKEKALNPSRDKAEQYFLTKGIRINLANINAFATCVEEIFIRTEYISRTISWLCNHDIRRGLQLSQRILTSPHISIDELVKTFIAGNHLRITDRSVKRALFLGDYNMFRQEDSSFVLNVFTVFPDSLGSPISKLSILQLLKDVASEAQESYDEYLEVAKVIAYLEPMGLSPSSTYKHVKELLAHRLIEPYDPASVEIDDSTRVRVTFSGQIHIDFALSDQTYLLQVGLTTPVREKDTADAMRGVMAANTRFTYEDWQNLSKLWAQYCLDEDSTFCVVPAAYQGQTLLRSQFKNRWIGNAGNVMGIEDEAFPS